MTVHLDLMAGAPLTEHTMTALPGFKPVISPLGDIFATFVLRERYFNFFWEALRGTTWAIHLTVCPSFTERAGLFNLTETGGTLELLPA